MEIVSKPQGNHINTAANHCVFDYDQRPRSLTWPRCSSVILLLSRVRSLMDWTRQLVSVPTASRVRVSLSRLRVRLVSRIGK